MGIAVHPALHEHGVGDGLQLRLVTAGCLLILLAFILTGCNGNSSLKSSNSETTVDGNTPATLALLAGSITGAGNFDGQGAEARFNSPQSIAVDLNDNIYIADTLNNRIRKISAYGDVTTVAGSGAYGRSNGQGIAASFNFPEAIAVDNKGNVYVADTYNNVIRKIDTEGNVTTLAGSGILGSFNGQGLTSSFNHPAGIAVDANGNVYVADTGNNLIRKIDTEGNVTTVAGSGESGFANGSGAVASFDYPHNIAIDANDNVYVADANNDLIRKIDSRGNVTTLAGGTFGNTNGPALSASFSNTYGVAVDTSGNVYVADTTNNLIRKIDTEGNVTTLAGDGSAGNIDGQGIAASFSAPQGVTVGADGNVYIADTGNNLVRKIDFAGNVTTLAGSTAISGDNNGKGATASFSNPTGVAADANGNVYVADQFNNLIRKIDPEGNVTTLAGGGNSNSINGQGSAASFEYPRGIAVDSDANVYVADNADSLIRKIDSAGNVTTLAGSSFGVTDGPALSASFMDPYNLDVDADGNVYVVGVGNRIRKIDSTDNVTTFAGSGKLGRTNGQGAAATFVLPQDLAVDASGNIYVADTGNNLVRKIDPNGNVTTLAGSGSPGGIKLGSLPGSLFQPTGIAIKPNGDLVITSDQAILIAHKDAGF